MKGNFEIKGLGKCLVGTYALRHLTKHFACSPEQLVSIPITNGMEIEWKCFMLKFCFENAQIQEKGTGSFKEKPIEEIELFLDESEFTTADWEAMYNALWIATFGMTVQEFAEKVESEKKKAEEPKEKKSNPTLTTGKK